MVVPDVLVVFVFWAPGLAGRWWPKGILLANGEDCTAFWAWSMKLDRKFGMEDGWMRKRRGWE